MQIIKADTSVVVMLGPAVDKTDGVTLESGLVTAMDTATTGVRISKNGGAWTDRNGIVTPTVYDEGWYRVTLDTTDTSVEGTLDVMYEDAATCLPMMARLQVVNANVYDSLFAVSGTDTLNAAVTEWNGVALATTNPLPNAAADAAGGLAISDAGGLDLDGRLDAAVSSRMATFTQPTGFLAATFPTTVASTTNITALPDVTLADGVIHGGTSAVYQGKEITITATDLNATAVAFNGTGTGHGLYSSAVDGRGIYGTSVSSDGVLFNSTNGTGLKITGEDALWARSVSGSAFKIDTLAGQDVESVTIEAILEDSNELQTNQGNWLTATGFMLATEDGSSFTAISSIGSVTGAVGSVTNDYSKYEGGAVWYDDVSGSTGFSDWINGIVGNPSSNEAHVGTLLASLGLKKVHMMPGSTFNLAGGATWTTQVLAGTNWTLTTTGSRPISGTTIRGATSITGTFEGANPPWFDNCKFDGITIVPACLMTNCSYGSNTLQLGIGDYDFINPTSSVPGTGSPVFDCDSPVSTQNISIRRMAGGIELQNLSANSTVTIGGTLGTVTLSGVSGTVEIRGTYKAINDTRTGSPVLNLDGAILAADVADIKTQIGTAGDGLTALPEVSADVIKISGNAASADNLELSAGQIIQGTASGIPDTTTMPASTLASTADDHWNGRIIIWTSGTLAGQATDITDYVDSTRTFTFTAVTTGATAGDTFVIV